MVHFLPLSLWEELGQPLSPEADSYIRVFSQGDPSLAELESLQNRISHLLSSYDILTENRIQEKRSYDRMIAGMQWIFGFFCVLLAAIGITNVFSNCLGFLRSRKREFAQYLSIGMTPKQMQKLLAIEAYVIAGQPLLLTLPLSFLFVEFAARASYLDPAEFWAEAPILPVILFAAAILFSVSLAYVIGAKSILHADLNETLRNDIT